MLSKLTFASFLVYAPRGTSDLSKQAKQFVRALKEERPIGHPPQIPSDYAARRLANELAKTVLAGFFGETVLLVPVPRSTLTVEGGLWPASNIASALVKEGIGARVLPCLKARQTDPEVCICGLGFTTEVDRSLRVDVREEDGRRQGSALPR